jgi:gamma-glutamylputrescine oxidase
VSFFARKFPQVSVRWEYIWPGLIGITKDLLPIAGQDERMANVYYAGAAAGLPWSAAAGRYIAEKIVGRRSDYDLFFSPRRSFFVSDSTQTLIGTKAAFGLSNLWSKYYEKE